jgi:hypothetical protein
LIFARDTPQDLGVLEMIVLICRALGLAFRGHRELVLENLALRQQRRAMKRTTSRLHLRTRDRLFWIALARVAALAHRVGFRSTGYRRALASRPASPPMGSTFEAASWWPPCRRSSDPRSSTGDGDGEPFVGEHRGFTASCAHSVSTSPSAPCRVCLSGFPARGHKRGGCS